MRITLNLNDIERIICIIESQPRRPLDFGDQKLSDKLQKYIVKETDASSKLH